MNALTKLQNAHRGLAEVSTAKEAKKGMDVAAAAEVYAKMAKLGEESELFAHSIKIDYQALLGGFLKNMAKAKGGAEKGVGRRGKQCGRPQKPHSETLEDIGVTKSLSSRSQALHTAKEKHPDLFEQVRKKKLAVADVAQQIGKRGLTEAEKESRMFGEIRRHSTRWLEGVCAILNAGVCPKMHASELDADLGLYAKDNKRRLTPERLRTAAAHLVAVAKVWTKT